jgi:nitrate reductase gamma subunit
MTAFFFFIAFPYLAWAAAILGGLYRYRTARYTWSSLSSQTLESRKLYWGSVAWHYAIIPILLAHLLAGVFPSATMAIVARPAVLFVLEIIGLGLGFLAFVGIVTLFARRLGASSPARRVTSVMDWLLLLCLILQVTSGIAIALFVRWGTRWYPVTAAPWMWSIIAFRPDAGPVVALPALAHFHFINGFVAIALFPFTRLVHLVSVPITYLWRPYQVVNWHGAPARGRRSSLP